ncbi:MULTISPECIES: DEAD/DEAH box helicase [Pseudidiomarina]|uniref:DEAD-box ATP-dependent RNA helicase RhpA n=3 Tax=Pseudidiomarina TaxID=2800384 RepID=A0A368V3W1_9GAMM|nr:MULTISPECIES: DEAD/DEAH box helicase [Pseudidiomarina]PWW14425.1 ATP-dependent RNA helicase RhlE [Pseudidiomarina maritima]RBP92575.1 ATP-dependent RNA helicase RhlE [Pseudidiomarina tainanensis]RCW34384.1 ATP-dependent RNA helicase RhlE [Pseudidiomarina tainanensis]
MSFSDLGLAPEVLSVLNEQGYTSPTPIQQQAIPPVLAGKDVMAAAQTGTGKTAGFTLPILELLKDGERARSNHVRALILTPTRELAAQVAESVATYGRNLSLSSAVVFGGVGINPQMMKLRKGVDILIATPGRLLDLFQQNAVKFNQLEILVLDEADRMLDMGFIHDIKKILRILPKKRQNLLFSATFSDEIRALAKGLVNDPVEVSVAPPNTTAERVEQSIYGVEQNQKTQLLAQLLRERNTPQVLVFTRTKHGANRLVKQLDGHGFLAAAIHGNKSQGARTKALDDFKNNRVQVLVATDIAARGIDIDLLPLVVNYDLPNVAEDYVHRIGRTARAGASGHALSLVSPEEVKQLKAIERLIDQKLERISAPGYQPVDLNKGRPAPKKPAQQPSQRRHQPRRQPK